MTRGTSNVPMIMGIIGGVLGIPASLCSGACGAAAGAFAEMENAATATAEQVGNFYLYLGLIGAILGLIGGIMGKKRPVPAGVMMLVATLMCGITLVIGNFMALLVAVLFLLGGVFCFTQKKEEVETI